MSITELEYALIFVRISQYANSRYSIPQQQHLVAWQGPGNTSCGRWEANVRHTSADLGVSDLSLPEPTAIIFSKVTEKSTPPPFTFLPI